MRRTIALFFALVSTCIATPAIGQSDIYDLPPVDLKFAGGTVGEYVETLREAAAGVNIVVMPEVEDVRLGPVELKQADLFASVMLLDDQEEQTAARIIRLKVELNPSSTEQGQDIFVIRGNVRDMARDQPATSMVTTVSDLLGPGTPITAEDLLSAVEAAMELTKGILPAADIRFHKETGLIIARGHPEQMNTIERVIDQLRNGVRRQAQEQQQAGKAEYEAEIQHLQMTLQQMQNEHKLMMTRMEQKIADLEARLSQRERVIGELQSELLELKKD
ncbi:MAG: hypothetical protein JSV91_10915 [Phycisphaerales bacterium]|nr:MAG: hypothetical protein JSV91_10915 [Phycisphaerales bacterium]